MNEKELRAEMVRKDETIESLAEKIGISRSAMIRKLQGKTEFRLSEILSIKESLQIEQDDINRIFFDKKVS